jgi:hypothetical protein
MGGKIGSKSPKKGSKMPFDPKVDPNALKGGIENL